VSVTFAKGFAASGVACGLKTSGKKDLAVVVNQGPLQLAAAVFTTNRCQANPILWSKEVIKDQKVSAIVLNSGGANCYTGPQGFQTTHATAEALANHLEVSSADVLVCSTGLIGEQLDRDKLLQGVENAVETLSHDGGVFASEAIMTTDSVAKRAEAESSSGWRIGGVALATVMRLQPRLREEDQVHLADRDVADHQQQD
jgi:glutamate N-acetyltransferase/amino-acid N-acetyltransferase